MPFLSQDFDLRFPSRTSLSHISRSRCVHLGTSPDGYNSFHLFEAAGR
jgi:hypothetical protein